MNYVIVEDSYVRTAMIKLKYCGAKHHKPNHILGLGGVMRFITLMDIEYQIWCIFCHLTL
jgi:hypothetical protein